MLRTRVLTAVIGLPLLVAMVVIGGWPFSIVIAVAVAIATWEFLHASHVELPGVALGMGLATGQVVAAQSGEGWPEAALIAAVAVPALWPVVAARVHTALADWSVVTLAVLYYGWFGSHAVLLRDLPDGGEWLFLGLFTGFATDTGAYFAGRSLGRRKLAPLVSPNKTWEGAYGGAASGFLVALLLNWLFDLGATAGEAVGFAILLPIAAILGDLAKSAVKRSLGVKDFGRIIPGHGGVADRIDSLLFALPVLYYWVRWIVM